MGINRGVCPECGYQSTWFKIRFYTGCAGVIFALITITAMLIMALFGPQP